MYPRTRAAERPDHAAVVMGATGETVTFRELDERSNRLARLWRQHGLGVGDHVAIFSENHPRFFEVMWAALRGFCLVRPDEWLERPGTVGRPLIGSVHIVGADGEELPPGEPGTIYFGDGPAYEYHNAPDKTAASKDPGGHGWTTLGDVGYVDDDGWLFLTDRQAVMIISGGVNIYPQEIEDCLTMHPKVADVAVFGIPDDEMGEAVQAAIQPADGVAGDDALASELRSYVREHIAHYKCPAGFEFHDQLPRLPTGKLYKHQLRAPYWDDRTSAI